MAFYDGEELFQQILLQLPSFTHFSAGGDGMNIKLSPFSVK